jgi:pyruvate,water dikinase
MAWIVDRSDPLSVEEHVSGGKGASLARLCRLGAKVPPFVVVSAQAYRDMGKGEPNDAFLAELRDALMTLNMADGLAVRSSAIGEDAADSSFAGLYHTSLEVKGFDSVVAALKTCWTSYRNVAAVQYRGERSADREDGAMAVVIQEMIEGDWSGVSFTANPVNLALSEGLINSVPGLGEALVSGEVNPEEIAIRASDGKILSRRAGDKPSPLPDDAVAEIWRVSKQIAGQLKFPQDLEWALRRGELFILQSRPITTIADVFYSRELEPWKDSTEADPDDPDRIWSRMLADETWVSPISPLFYNIHNSTPGRVGFIRAHGDKSYLPPDLFKYHRATAYADIDMIRKMYAFQPRLARIRGILNFLPENMQDDFKNIPFRWAGRLRRMLSYEFANRETRSFFKNYRHVNSQWPDYVAKSDRWLDTDLDALSLDDLRKHQAAVRDEMIKVGAPCAVAVLSHAQDLHLLLTGLLDRWFTHLGSDGENLYARISSGLDDSETVKEGEALWSIAQKIRAIGPQAVAAAQASDWAMFKGRIARMPGGGELIANFETFWRGHRHLGSTYKDVVWPRWGDDIDQCFSTVKGYIDSTAMRPSEFNARSAKARREAQAELLAALRGPAAPIRRRILRWLFRYNEAYMSVRDNHRYYVDRNWYEIRRIYLSYGMRLVKLGVLRAREDVFFLGVAEVDAGLAGTLDSIEARRRIEVRRKVWETTLRAQGPKFLKGWAPYSDKPRAAQNSTSRLHGIAASPGTAIGTARIVYDVRELSTVKDGEILVTRQTDPSWTMVFGRIHGLVLETGGVLSHGTSLCREYGLPCVTAVEQATVRIPDGSQIELIGSEGTVRILEVA